MESSRHQRAVEQALQEHHDLLEIETHLSRLFARETCPAFKVWIDEVRSAIGKLQDLLVPHFKSEETEGLHEAIAEALPNQTRRLEKLFQEHEGLLAQLRRLREAADRADRPPDDQALRREASDFFAALDRHERGERELFLLALEGEGPAPD